jgi:L,D-peptidoglycan transpeptidase YkuD (ErfK/YbiS/YcfS/YnhG family)
VRELKESDGWCDAPADPQYNRLVQLPYPASAESLWRSDHLYDIIAVLGYNDDPVVPGRGSAIFLHVARANYGPTAGCVAFAKENLIEILARATRSTRVIVRAEKPAGP